MTISSYDNRRSYAGNGSTVTFAFPPPFAASSDLVVQVQAADGSLATKLLGTDYTVSGAGNPGGGTVTMTAAPPTGTTLILYRDVPLTQPVALLDGGPLPAATLNGMLDRVTMWGQRLKEQIGAIGGLASAAASGLMSATDKAKLDAIQAGAQVNAVTSVAGRTGDVMLARGDIGLGNVDNTADAAKPVSSAMQAALNLKASTASLAAVATSGAYADLGGKPTLGTAAAQNSTAFATAAQGAKADSALQSIVAGSNISINNTDPRNPVITAIGAGGGGGGDVTGPTAATDGAYALFDGTTGKLLKNGALPFSGAYADLTGKPALATVATSGAYGDLSGKPALAAVATSGAYGDLSGRPTLGTMSGKDAATATEMRAGSAVKGITVDQAWVAAQFSGLTDGATITPDFSLGWNFWVTLAGNRTLAFPTNPKVGQTGAITVYQDAVGSRTLAFASGWRFAGGSVPTLSTNPNAMDKLYFFVETASIIHASLVKGIA